MAIKVSGTTVVDDSRNLQNLVNLNTSGNVYANTFVGDADQLTNLPASGGSFEATASGTLADGSTVIVNADGTVSAVSATAGGLNVGSVVTPISGSDGLTISSLSSTKFVGFARNGGASNDGVAVIGTISGNSVTFGDTADTGVTIMENPIAVAISETQFVVVYVHAGDSNKGKAIVGTVTGNSISYGSPTTFETGQVNLVHSTGPAVRLTDTKLMIVFTDASDSSKAKAIIGTVSGSSISFGSPATFGTSNSSKYSVVSKLSDTSAIIAWSDTASTERGKAVVATISGTSISFGTSVVFDSTYIIRFAVAALSSTKFVIAYQDDRTASTKTGKAIVGTISGTAISLGSESTFTSGNLNNNHLGVVKTGTDEVRIAFPDPDNSSYPSFIPATISGTSITYGTKVVLSSVGNVDQVYVDSNGEPGSVFGFERSAVSYGVVYGYSTNLTSENFIGISDGAYANNATATIQIKGAVDDAQSGLTPGQQYFVQANGSINTTAADPSVFAGTAIASNKLIVKG